MTQTLHPDFSWIELHPAGFFIRPGSFFLDPRMPVARAVVSHAHADHYPKFLQEVHAHPDTLALAQIRYRNSAGKMPHGHKYGEPFRIGEVKITFFPAGHILGSCQILLEYGGQRVLWTGDIAFSPQMLCVPFQDCPLPVDLLITESTFGEKEQHRDARQSLESALAKAGTRPLLIAAYPIGKAQRINRLLNDLAPQIPVFVHREILPFYSTYQNAGFDPGTFQVYQQRKTGRHAGPFAYLVPPLALSGFQKDFRYYKLFASGFNQSARFPHLDGQLDISDHASGGELIQMIRRLSPGRVAFWHGYPDPLIAACQDMKIPAFPVTLPKISKRR